MVSSVSSNAADLALVTRAQASVPLAAQVQSFLNGPSSAQQRDAELPSPLEIVQSTNSPVDGRTLVAAQESSEQNDQQTKQQFSQQNGQTSNTTTTHDQSDPEQSATGDSEKDTDAPENKEGAVTPANPQGLTNDERQQVQKLKRIDREVRSHERAHQNAAPDLTGPASFTTVRGPDGKLYAVGGEVSIDTGEAATPQATIQKLKRIIKAALAPLEPSAQDRKVAAQARAEIAEARNEIQEEKAIEKEKVQEAKEERQNSSSNNEASPIQSDTAPDVANAIQAFQAAAALGSGNTAGQARTSAISI